MCVVVTHKNYATTYIGLCGSFCSKGVRIYYVNVKSGAKRERDINTRINIYAHSLARSLTHKCISIRKQKP